MTAMIRLQIVLLVLAPLLVFQIIQADMQAATTPVAGCGRPARSLDELRQLAE